MRGAGEEHHSCPPVISRTCGILNSGCAAPEYE